jgi:hypothetical protein
MRGFYDAVLDMECEIEMENAANELAERRGAAAAQPQAQAPPAALHPDSPAPILV